MKNILWEPKDYHYQDSNIAKYISYINKNYNKDIIDYDTLYDWSISNIDSFWESILKFCDIDYSSDYDSVLNNPSSMLNSSWFDGLNLNFAENLLKFRDNKIAIEYFYEDKIKGEITYSELFDKVKSCSSYLKSIGVKKGDRVAAFMPNIPETIIGMLATTSLGAIWSSCSPDFGINGVLDRFSQIEPKVLFVTDGYFYKGKEIDLSLKIKEIIENLKSVKHVICKSIIHSESLGDYTNWDQIEDSRSEINFCQTSFSDPLYIMYSSGTTGKPKSIVHSSGGTLLQHMKELIIHTDLKRDDKIFYFTTCGWMMWNWLVSSLAVGATIVLYEGNPFFPNKDSLLKIMDNIDLTVFGTSAKYISGLEQNKIKPNKNYSFDRLRSILSTGSPLVEENFDYVYKYWKEDVQLCSISGGTDIISCFALGNPIKPVVKGKLQSIGLGMSVKSFDDYGNHQVNNKGELVCDKPFPSMPIYFLNDKDNIKYKKAYFNTYSNIWKHGDYISIYTDGTVKIFGRSDTTLNPGGVRIGTAEIYRVMDKFSDIEDSVVVGYKYNNDELVILFVKMIDSQLTSALKDEIKSSIKINCSPRHIPYEIFQIEDIPYTINGKKVEIAVKNILENKKISNLDSLSNPKSLEYYKSIKII